LDLILIALFGLAGGVVAGMLGVGGGVIFVPALVIVFDEPQVRAEATSLLAIVPVAIVGSIRQHRYGNVHVKVAIGVGVLSLLGVAAGVLIANAVSQRTLEVMFACVTLFFAGQMLRRGLRPSEPSSQDAAMPAKR
jgi:hypothetical protein